MSQLTLRGLDNTSSAFVSDIYIQGGPEKTSDFLSLTITA